MPHFDPWGEQHRRESPGTVSVDFDGGSLVFRKVDEPLYCLWLDRVEEYRETYVTGKPARGGEEAADPKPLLTPAGIIPASETLLRTVAAAQTLHVPGAGEQPYTFEDWLGFVAWHKDLWRRVRVVLRERMELGDAEGNASGAATETS